MAILDYIEAVCVSEEAANLLVNSRLAVALLSLLRNTSLPTMRIRLATVLGLLVRHATTIEASFSRAGNPKPNFGP